MKNRTRTSQGRGKLFDGGHMGKKDMMAPDEGKTSFRFLDLPAELRNRIYETVLVREWPINIGTVHWTPEGWPYVQMRAPAISRVCRQMRKESLALYYSVNAFEMTIKPGWRLDPFDVLASYFDAVGEDFCRSFKQVHLNMRGDGPLECRDLIPLVRVFCRGSKSIPPATSLSLSHSWGGFHDVVWDGLSWESEFVQDLASVGHALHSQGIVGPDDNVIEEAVLEHLSIEKILGYREKSTNVWKGMWRDWFQWAEEEDQL